MKPLIEMSIQELQLLFDKYEKLKEAVRMEIVRKMQEKKLL